VACINFFKKVYTNNVQLSICMKTQFVNDAVQINVDLKYKAKIKIEIFFTLFRRTPAELTAYRDEVADLAIEEAVRIGYTFKQVEENDYEGLPSHVPRPPLHAVAWTVANRKRKDVHIIYSKEKSRYSDWLKSDIDNFRTKIQAGKFKINLSRDAFVLTMLVPPALKPIDEQHQDEAAACSLKDGRNAIDVKGGVPTACFAILDLDAEDFRGDPNGKGLTWIPLVNNRELEEVRQQARNLAESEKKRSWW